MKKNRNVNCTYIEKIKTQHVKDILKIRVEINRHLDDLEKQIIRDLEEKEGQCKEDIQKVLSSIRDKEAIISQYHSKFQNIKQYASDLQTFLGIGEFKVKVNEHKLYLQSLMDTKGFEQFDLVFKIDTDVQSILNGLKHFGSTEIKARPSNFGLSRSKDKQAQLQVEGTKKTINDVKLILQKKIKTYGDTGKGCCVSEVGQFLFIDHCSRKLLSLISSGGTLKLNLLVHPSDGFDIACIDKKTVAITTGHSSKKTGIDIKDIENGFNIKFINLPDRSLGITRDHDSLFVCVAALGIYKINIVDHTSHLIICKVSLNSYVSVFGDNIYYTNSNDHSVVCCDRN
ncbi:unnamed protein product [Mytilus coruscus]|uniref:Uncharacterized protein n=1 Tax=Mytilus coruscus TaxID=42192 RepID=A0A6J8D760_MYTCO|nr:unnamed protein product [Mytilus coruscus]